MNTDGINIAFCISNFRAGGAETQYWNLIHNLDRTIYRPYVVMLESPGYPAQPELAGDVPYIVVQTRFLFDPAAVLKITKFIKQHDIQIVQSLLFRDNQFARVSAAFAGVPAITSVRGELRPILGWKKTRLEYLMQRLSTKIITNSDWLKRQLVENGSVEQKVVVIANGVNFQKLHAIAGRQRIREELGVFDDRPLVGIVARLHPMKDHRTFLRTFALIAQKYPDARAVVVGQGPLDQALREEVKSMGLASVVHFVGEVRNDIGSWFRAMDLMLFTSRWGESFPNVLLEAMFCGVPIVATDVSAVNQIIDSGKNGHIAPIGDHRKLAALACDVLSSDARRAEFVAKARDKVAEFTVEAMVLKYQSLYASLAK